jgi:hypothetical protein
MNDWNMTAALFAGTQTAPVNVLLHRDQVNVQVTYHSGASDINR